MKTVMKIAPFLLLALLLVSVGVNIWQGKDANEKEDEIKLIIQDLEETKNANKLLSSTNQILEDKVAILQDSIDVLNQEIQELGRSLRSKVREVKSNRQKIAQLQARADGLLKEINALRSSKSTDAAKIKELEDQRLDLDVKLGDLFIKNDSLNNENTALLENLVDSETVRDSLEGQLQDSTFLANLTDFDPADPFKISPSNISVFFNTVTPLVKTNKVANNPKKWNATLIEFQLAYNNKDVARLVNHDFILQIIDDDTGEIISPRESSSGENDTKGLEFTFAKNPVSVQYVNYQKKKGQNFVVQLSYMDREGKKVVLPTGIKPITFPQK